MKKLTSVILVPALVLSLGITAFADTVTGTAADLALTSSQVPVEDELNLPFQVEYQNKAGTRLG